MWFVRVCVNEQPPLIKISLLRSVMEWDKQEAYSLKDDTVCWKFKGVLLFNGTYSVKNGM